MEKDILSISGKVSDMSRELQRKCERLTEEAEMDKAILMVLESWDSLVEENEKLQQQLAEERKQRAELEMQYSELSKLSAGVAKKASQEELLKAMRTFVNKSKRKTLGKRTQVKNLIMDMANTIGLTFPEDFSVMLDSLDDEQPESAVTVNVAAGGINVQQANRVK